MNDQSGEFSRSRLVNCLLMLWLSGVALRLTILAVPPVIPHIHDDLHLTETEVGILMGLPSMLFAIAAVPGSLLVARLGARAALVAGLAIAAAAGALRGFIHDLAWLYAMTIAMGAGVAVMQVTLPSTVREWLPDRIGFATAVYTNGLLVGEILPVALMIPFVLPLTGGSWPMAFAAWSAPVALIALLVMMLAPRHSASGTLAAPSPPRRWWPDWKAPLIWRLGIMLGTVNAIYFATNAFLPDYLDRTGQREWISAALTGLNLGQLPASFLLLGFAGRFERAAWPYVLSGGVSLLGILGIVVGSGPWIVVATSVLGFAAAATLILALALPPLLSEPDDVHRTTAAMFTISYSCAVLVPIVSGLSWDLTGVPATAFVPIGLCALVLMWLAPAVTHAGRGEARNGV